MRTIWKFPLAVTDGQTLQMPQGAEIVHLSVQDMDVCLWALVDTDAKMVPRTLFVRGTGHGVPEAPYVGSVLQGPFVWHVFDMGEQ